MIYLLITILLLILFLYFNNKIKYPNLISKRANNDNFMFNMMSKLLLKSNKTCRDIKNFVNKRNDDIDILINNRGSCLKCPGFENIKFQQLENDSNKLNCENIKILVDNVDCNNLQEYSKERKREIIDHTNLLLYYNQLKCD